VIILTRLNGPSFALNTDLIERAEETPDTVITLVDGKHYVVAESLGEVLTAVQHERAAVLALSASGLETLETSVAEDPPRTTSDVIPLRRNV
jgi:flagellar protein FlbD